MLNLAQTSEKPDFEIGLFLALKLLKTDDIANVKSWNGS